MLCAVGTTPRFQAVRLVQPVLPMKLTARLRAVAGVATQPAAERHTRAGHRVGALEKAILAPNIRQPEK